MTARPGSGQTRRVFAWRAPHAFDGTRFLAGGATVLVDGERIIGVEAGDYPVPDGCEVSSYDGTLMPGLVDAHVHLVADASPGSLERVGSMPPEDVDAVIASSLAAQAAHGVTTVLDLGDIGYRTLAFRDRAVPGQPRIVAAGPPITPASGHCHFLGSTATTHEELRAAVAEHHARGVDVIKVMASGGFLTVGTDMFGAQYPPADIRVVVEAAHEVGLRVFAHAHSVARDRSCPGRGSGRHRALHRHHSRRPGTDGRPPRSRRRSRRPGRSDDGLRRESHPPDATASAAGGGGDGQARHGPADDVGPAPRRCPPDAGARGPRRTRRRLGRDAAQGARQRVDRRHRPRHERLSGGGGAGSRHVRRCRRVRCRGCDRPAGRWGTPPTCSSSTATWRPIPPVSAGRRRCWSGACRSDNARTGN